MKLNREQIEHTLEICSSGDEQCAYCCPLAFDGCARKLAKLALALVRELTEEVAKAKADTVRDMQERLEERIDQTIQVFDFQISECNAVRQALRGVKNDIHQVAKEILEEAK